MLLAPIRTTSELLKLDKIEHHRHNDHKDKDDPYPLSVQDLEDEHLVGPETRQTVPRGFVDKPNSPKPTQLQGQMLFWEHYPSRIEEPF
jgi:hypothetical protein